MADFYLRFSGIDPDTGNAVGWLGDECDAGRMPALGASEFMGRVDAVLSFFIEAFLHDDVFEEGDRLLLAGPDEKGARLLLRKASRLRAEA